MTGECFQVTINHFYHSEVCVFCQVGQVQTIQLRKEGFTIIKSSPADWIFTRKEHWVFWTTRIMILSGSIVLLTLSCCILAAKSNSIVPCSCFFSCRIGLQYYLSNNLWCPSLKWISSQLWLKKWSRVGLNVLMVNPFSLAVMDLDPLEVGPHHVVVTEPPETCHVAAENCFGFCSKSADCCRLTIASWGSGETDTENKHCQLRCRTSAHLWSENR